MQREASFLDSRASLNAAASLLLAINISKSNVALEIGITKISEIKMNNLLHLALTQNELTNG